MEPPSICEVVVRSSSALQQYLLGFSHLSPRMVCRCLAAVLEYIAVELLEQVGPTAGSTDRPGPGLQVLTHNHASCVYAPDVHVCAGVLRSS